MKKKPAVYILANKKDGVLYIGVTSNLIQRVWQHKHNAVDGFSKKYHIHILVYFEIHESMVYAIQREKQVKWWRRAWKVSLIEQENPDWHDLFFTLTGK